ncbi:MAG TPA: hypothetical protein PKG95_04445 [Anaerolineaceae bacterium]|nr:hypothetical protein [Anaerolineaceae bacterium]
MVIAAFLMVVLLLALIGVLAVALIAVSQTSARLAETALVQAQTTAVSAASNLIWQVLFVVLCLGMLALLTWAIWQRRQNLVLQRRLERAELARTGSSRRWAPGPNAGWRRLDEQSAPAASQLIQPTPWSYPYPPVYPPVYTMYPPYALPPSSAEYPARVIEHKPVETNPFNFDL